jgi:LacI family transcriptional regulator
MSLFKKSTLTDVAQRAGVSVTTASYILNGRSTQMRISAETERRVQAAIRDLNYRPNWSARNLRRSSTKTIGVISDFVASGAFSSQLLTGASVAARLSGHLLVIGESMGDRDAEELLIEDMVGRQVDGVIYATRSTASVRVPDKLRDVRAVLLNCLDDDLALPTVLPDDVRGGRTAVEHLVAAGVMDPIYVVGEDPTTEATAGLDRVRGINAALVEAGRELAGCVSCPWDVAPAYDAMEAQLRTGVRPGALICLNDRVAMGVYQALAEYRLSVPDDVSVIAFDGSDLASWLRPRLTSLALPFRDMGALAVEMLMNPGSNAGPLAGVNAGTVTRLPLELQAGSSVRGAVPARSEARRA